MPSFFRYCITLPLVFTVSTTVAQIADIEKLAAAPKKNTELPVDYSILLPRLDVPDWNQDNSVYDHFITRAVSRTQMAMSYKRDDNVKVTMNIGSAYPHAQLDTSTLITDVKQLIGTWRAISSRRLSFRDSVEWDAQTFLRNNTLLNEQKGDDLFLQITDKQIRMYAKPEGKDDFKRAGGSRYVLESGRYLLSYKIAKGGAGVSQAGIDKEGRLILNAPMVQIRKLPNYYIVYEAIINQTIYERINERL